MSQFEKQVYVDRREKLRSTLGSGQVLLLGNNEASMNFKDNWYHFRQDSTMLYYTGIDIPGIHLLMDIDNGNDILFGNELTLDDIVWTGPLPSLERIATTAGISMVRPLLSLNSSVKQDVMYLPPYRAQHSLYLSSILGKGIDEILNSISKKLILAIVGQRNVKEAREIKEMELGVRFSYDMHSAVMKGTHPGMREHELVGIAAAQAYNQNVHFSYPAILTRRGEVLHNHDHSGLLSTGDMVLYDGGCESPMHYAGDITRTFPVSGKWNPLQKDLYDIVYDAYALSVDALKPGVKFIDIHLIACKAIFSGMKALGFAKGNVADAIVQGAHTMFFQCGLGHLIGLDVHDMENLGEQYVGYGARVEKSKDFGLKSLRLGRSLEPGFTVTIEPGIYIIPSLIEMRKNEGAFHDFINYDKLEKYQDVGGIRLEDNFLITKDGYKMIGADYKIPRTSNEVEDFMNS